MTGGPMRFARLAALDHACLDGCHKGRSVMTHFASTGIAAALLVLLAAHTVFANTTGFVYSVGTRSFTSFDVPGAPLGINDLGQIVGNDADNHAGFPVRGYLKDGSSLTLFEFPNAYNTSPAGINNAGQIVGQVGLVPPDGHGFL